MNDGGSGGGGCWLEGRRRYENVKLFCKHGNVQCNGKMIQFFA